MASITSSHTFKQLKFIISGLIATYASNVIGEVKQLLDQRSWTWQRITISSSIGFGVITVLLFFYVLILLPRVRGINHDYKNWQNSPRLKVVVPALTFTIVVGWSSLLFSLTTWSNLGFIWSSVGAVGIYILAFGLMGLIPAPRRRQ